LADIFRRRMAKLVGKVTGEKDYDEIVRRQKWIRFTELTSGNRHMHCVATFSKAEAEIYKKRAKHVWAKLARKGTTSGKLFMREYGTMDGEHTLAWYNTKDNELV
jgi:hypothetical protein